MVHRSIFCWLAVALLAACSSSATTLVRDGDGSAGATASGGTAGAGSGGAGTAGIGGAAGTAGQGGATGGSGGDADSSIDAPADVAPEACSPDRITPATLVATLPTTFAWPSWSYTWNGECISCSLSPCASSVGIDLLPSQATWNGSELLLPVEIRGGYVSIRAGTCGSEADCSFKPLMMFGVKVTLEHATDGWRITSVHMAADVKMDVTTCYSLMPAGTAAALTKSLTDALSNALVGLVLPCP